MNTTQIEALAAHINTLAGAMDAEAAEVIDGDGYTLGWDLSFNTTNTPTGAAAHESAHIDLIELGFEHIDSFELEGTTAHVYSIGA